MSNIAWNTINWSQVEFRVKRYQTRIYKASKDNNKRKVRCLQKRLLNSFDAKMMAVRQATTLTKSKKTLGVDKNIFVTDVQKGKLVQKLKLDRKTIPIKQLYLNKPERKEKRLQSIPIIKDRAKQALCLLILEPEWEARFEPNSYGFRPGRSGHDAIESIFVNLQKNSGNYDYHNHILYININKCLGKIDHNYLITKLGTIPEIKNQVKTWLKSNIFDEFQVSKIDRLLKNIENTAQEEIISPLLLNIALHGMENYMKNWIITKPLLPKTKKQNNNAKSIAIIRYANDFVIIHKKQSIIREAKDEIAKWLWDGPRLKLSETETTIVDSNHGFDFLGFSIITIARGKSRVKIYPCRKSQAILLINVRNILQKNRSTSTYNLILKLRPIIIGWANYFKYSHCQKVFHKLTYLIHQKLRAWVFRRDTRNGRIQIKQRYFPSGKTYTYNGIQHQDNWILNGKQIGKNGEIKEIWLPNIAWVKSKKWVKIKADKSPYDGDNVYWAKRRINKDR
uniref:Putative reverse transcriptase n=1 Tax=Toxarium undulatum TaxID=210620 RepID=A0A1D8D957_9STRA|nr:putative reverse transcriptase [Toxarium undulatum]AOS86555.1 putative reverse transcriptase [Toxarium undulatum]